MYTSLNTRSNTSQILGFTHADPDVGWVISDIPLDLDALGGHLRRESLGITPDIGKYTVSLRWHRRHASAPLGVVHHRSAFKHFGSGKGNEIVIDIAVIGRRKPDAIRPRHYEAIYSGNKVWMSHAVTNAHARHTEDF